MTNKKSFIGIIIFITIVVSIFLFLQKDTNKPIKTVQNLPQQIKLSLSPNPLHISSNNIYTENIVLDTGDNEVSFVQLKLTYDPVLLTDMKIQKGPFMSSATVLFEQVNTTNGTITYMLSIPKTEKEINGKGIVAVLSFTNTMRPKDVTPLKFSQDTLVTNNENPNSLPKKTIDATITRENNK